MTGQGKTKGLAFAPLIFASGTIVGQGNAHRESATKVSGLKLQRLPSLTLKMSEAISGTSPEGAAVTREAGTFAGTPFAAVTIESNRFQVVREGSRFRESDETAGQPTVFRVKLIEEGLGNFRDMFFYTREALATACALFEGEKAMVNHETEAEAEERPERDVRDIGGHYENLSVDDDETGRAYLGADLVIPAGASYDLLRSQMRHAITFNKKHPDKDFIGLSIAADGDAVEMPLDQFIKDAKFSKACLPKLRDAQAQGMAVVKPVNVIDKVDSCDVVTKPGAGGKILSEKGGN